MNLIIIWLYMFLFVCVNLLYNSCQNNASISNATVYRSDQNHATSFPKKQITTEKVKVLKLQRSNFQKEIIATGKLEAFRKANLHFKIDGVIDKIMITEGEFVKFNQKLASLLEVQQNIVKQQFLLRYQKSKLEYEDLLLRQGYQLSDTANLPTEVKVLARLRSGLIDLELENIKSEIERKNHFLYAPFEGKIANLKSREFNLAYAFDSFCTLIDDHEFYFDFLIMEQELSFIKNSNHISVASFSEPDIKYKGRIKSISPLVDQGGMIRIKGHMYNNGSPLMDGMGIRVFVSQTIPKQFVIPKQAVVDRQGRKVVFTVTNKNTAYWNYVEILWENSEFYAIKGGLQAGDQVIYDGNFNLAHDNPIEIVSDF